MTTSLPHYRNTTGLDYYEILHKTDDVYVCEKHELPLPDCTFPINIPVGFPQNSVNYMKLAVGDSFLYNEDNNEYIPLRSMKCRSTDSP